MILLNGFKVVEVTNSNLCSSGTGTDSGLYVANFEQDTTVTINNCVVILGSIFTDPSAYRKEVTVNLTNSTYYSYDDLVATLFVPPSGYSAVTSYTDTNNVSNGLLSALNVATIDFRNSVTSNYLRFLITSGDQLTETIGVDWFGGDRDGVGALYFEAPDTTLSASALSGYSPLTLSFSVSSTSANNFSPNIDFTFDDGNVSATTNLLITHTFSACGFYHPFSTITSYNSWNEVVGDSITISAFDVNLSATWNIFAANTTSAVAVATTSQNLTISGTVTSGTGSAFRLDLGPEIVEGTITNNIFSYDYYYEDVGSYTLSLSAYNAVNQSFISTHGLTVSLGVGTTYYADINTSADTTSANPGTSANPLDWKDLVTFLETSGAYQDIFRLKGYKNIEIPVGTIPPYTPINIDSTKRFTIRDWDNLTYGPWMISIEDYSSEQNTNIDFRGTTLRNGIIYNKPHTDNSIDYGGTLNVSNLYCMYIVYDGAGSALTITPVTSAVEFLGCTLRVENGIVPAAESAYTFDITDSVLVGFENSGTTFSSPLATFSIYNCCFDSTSGSISATNTSGCQYSWTPPDNYPFLKDKVGYDEDIAWLMTHKHILYPFDGINTPPQGGKNFPTYTNYETGLFGYQRKFFK